MSVHGYPTSVTVADALSAGAGIALTGTPLVLIDLGFAGSLIFGLLFLVFCVFSTRTLVRHLRQIRLDPEAVTAIGPFGCRLSWSQLAAVRLRYYSTRHDRERGWFELVLTDGNRRQLSLDGRLSGFDSIARATARFAIERGLRCDAATVHNFRMLGIPISGSGWDA